MYPKKRSRPIFSTLCFVAASVGQIIFIRSALTGGLSSLPGWLLAELGSCVAIFAVAIFTLSPKGWRNTTGIIIASVLTIAYIAFNLVFYRQFSALYLSCITTEFPSYGPAIEALKLLLVAIAYVGCIPVMDSPDSRAYANAMHNAVARQELEWAKNSAIGAREDLDKTVSKLKKSMTEEELAALIEELRQIQTGEETGGETAKAADDAPAGLSEQNPCDDEHSAPV